MMSRLLYKAGPPLFVPAIFYHLTPLETHISTPHTCIRQSLIYRDSKDFVRLISAIEDQVKKITFTEARPGLDPLSGRTKKKHPPHSQYTYKSRLVYTCAQSRLLVASQTHAILTISTSRAQDP